MIDLHNHVLPGIDDGAADMAESVGMCRIAASEGIRVIVATPHSFDGDHVTAPNVIVSMVKSLNDAVQREGLDLRILPGMEIRVVPELLELLLAGRLLALNHGRYLLLEFQHAHVPAGFERLVGLLKEAGYGIVLGHPEKNLRIQRDREYLPKLMSSIEPWDLIIQISADSLTGSAGPDACKTARFLMKKGLVHVIATDAHSVTTRPPVLSEALADASRIVGQSRVQQMLCDVPLAILNGIGFPQLEEVVKPRRWWQIFS
ncbi:MAG: tyrosine protein phosphatase [Desulfomonile tiedjei]|uniref:protein-tyrosine-phosphatase n=1 Tax=Desulfomonile tiedjei TaxID=2358 RepID=A0A9D6V5F5_9BACT|nr:tyrosine protein phosphatase [Desulfomonile tiedjei]